MRVDVLWVPAEVGSMDLGGRLVVVLDVLRATTSILAALEAGARGVIPVESTEEAMRVADSRGRKGTLLCGERGGRRIEGFDLGNSPADYTSERVGEATLVYDTTNGTGAIRRARTASELVLGSFWNLSAVADRIASAGRPAAVLCAGREGRVSLDDALCAGHLVEAVGERVGGELETDDGAHGARELARRTGPPTASWLAGTAAGAALVEIGLEEDLERCARMDVSDGLPTLADGELALRGSGAAASRADP